MTQRVIIKLDVKRGYIIKGRRYEGLKKIQKLTDFLISLKDSYGFEIVINDTVATLFNRFELIDELKQALPLLNLPVTVMGGVNDCKYVQKCFELGADRIAINSHNFDSLDLIRGCIDKYGSQATVAAVEVKNIDGYWMAMKKLGREIGDTLENHLARLNQLNFSEMIIINVDRDGTQLGSDFELIEYLSENTDKNIIYSGGLTENDFHTALPEPVSGKCVSTLIYSKIINIAELELQCNM